MNIQSVGNFKVNFKGARLNINALSDPHGCLDKLDTFYKNMEENKEDIFLKEEKGNQNALIIAGDWFISGTSKGYKTDAEANAHDFQIKFFNKFAEKTGELGAKQKTYFIPGNHEFDGGEDEFARVAESIDAKTLITNLDFENSPILQGAIDSGKVIQKEIMEIPDDKNPNKTHKVLLLGISPVNMPAYNNSLRGINFTDQIPKAQKLVNPEDYQATLDETVGLIREFKNKNPKGLVVVSSHTGVDFSENLAKVLGDDINLIFDAHEHRDETREVNGVKIVKLSQNLKKYVNAKFEIGDDGKLKKDVELNVHYPFKETGKAETSFFKGFFEGLFSKDLTKDIHIRPKDPTVETLDIETVRSGNSYLANFVTDSILEQIQKTNPEVEIFGISASAIRRPLDTEVSGGANNISVIETLSGIVHGEGGIYKNEVDGNTLLGLVLDNLLFNEKAPERNPLIQYSGLIVERKALLEDYYAEDKSPEELMAHIRLAKTGEPIKGDETYTVANVEKYFKKSKNPLISATLYKTAEPLNLNARDLFPRFIEENKDNLSAKCDIRVID